MNKKKCYQLKSFFHKLLVYILIFSHVLHSTQAVTWRIEELDPEIYLKRTSLSGKSPIPSVNHTVDLDKDVNENFSVNLSSFSSEPCKVDYFNKGSLIAQAFLHDDYVIFQGNENYNFVIDGPIKTNEFFCKTRGNLTFLKEVSALFASIKSNNLLIRNQVSIKENAEISSLTDIITEGRISANFLKLTSKGNTQLLGDINTQKSIIRIGDTLDIGNQKKTTSNKAINSFIIKAKKINNFSNFVTDAGRLVLKADEIYNASSASIVAGEKLAPNIHELTNDEARIPEHLGRLVIHSDKFQNASGALLKSGKDLFLKIKNLINDGTIEGISGGFLENQSFKNSGSGIVHMHKQFNDNSNFFENRGKMIFDQASFIKTKKFSNLNQWQSLGLTNVTATELLYNSGELYFSQPATLHAPNIMNMNGGCIEASHSLKVQGNEMKNYGHVDAKDSLEFSLVGDFLNDSKGIVNIQKLAQISYQRFTNKGKWRVEGDIISQGQQFINDNGAHWFTKGIWEQKSNEVTLCGRVDAGALALFDIEKEIKFSGKLYATSLRADSKLSITSDPAADFNITHHLRLSAAHNLNFDSQALNRRLTNEESLPTTSEQQRLAKSLSKGIFLSGGKSLSKAGQVRAEQGSVEMRSNKDLIHDGLTESGINSDNAIVLQALELLKIKGQLRSYGILNLSSDTNIENNAYVKASNIKLKAKNNILNKGNIEAQENFFSRSRGFKNEGTTQAKNLHIKADQLFFNNGVIKGDQATIDALISTNLGRISSKNLVINTALDLNMGLRSAYNINLNSFLSLNGGLNLPRVNSWDDIMNWQNAKMAGKTLFTTFVPSQTRLLYNVGIAASRMPQMYRQGHQIWNSALSLQQQEEIGFSDLIPLLCGIKDLTTSSIQFTSSLQRIGEGNSSSQALSWQSTAGTIVGSVGPHLNTDSLININLLGGNIGVNTYERNLYNFNYGTDISANTYTTDTLFGQNKGLLAASRLNVSVQQDYESAGALLGISGSFTAPSLLVSGYTGFYENFEGEGNDVTFTADTLISPSNFRLTAQDDLQYSGRVEAGEVELKSKNTLEIQGGAQLNGSRVFVEGKERVANAGSVHAKTQVAVKTDGSFLQTKEAKLTGKNVSTEARNVDNAGLIKGQEQTYVRAERTVVNRTSGIIEGGTAYVEGKKRVANAGSVHAKTQVAVKTDGSFLQTKEAKLTGENVSAEARNVGNAGLIKGQEQTYLRAEKKFVNRSSGIIEGGTAYVEGKERVANAGSVHAKTQAAVKTSGSFLQAKEAKLTSENVSAEAQNIDNAGLIKGQEQTYVRAEQTVVNRDSGTIDGGMTYVEGKKHVENAGNINGKDQASVKTDGEFSQTTGAKLTGKNVSAEAQNIDNAGLIKGQKQTYLRAEEKFVNRSSGAVVGPRKTIGLGEEGTINLQRGSHICSDESIIQAEENLKHTLHALANDKTQKEKLSATAHHQAEEFIKAGGTLEDVLLLIGDNADAKKALSSYIEKDHAIRQARRELQYTLSAFTGYKGKNWDTSKLPEIARGQVEKFIKTGGCLEEIPSLIPNNEEAKGALISYLKSQKATDSEKSNYFTKIIGKHLQQSGSIHELGHLEIYTEATDLNEDSRLNGRQGTTIATTEKLTSKGGSLNSDKGSIVLQGKNSDLVNTVIHAGQNFNSHTTDSQNIQGGSVKTQGNTTITAQDKLTIDTNIQAVDLMMQGKNTSVKGQHRARDNTLYQADEKLEIEKGMKSSATNISIVAPTINQGGRLDANSSLQTVGNNITISGVSKSVDVNVVGKLDKRAPGTFMLTNTGEMEGHVQQIDMSKDGKVHLQAGSSLKTNTKDKELGFTSIIADHLEQKGEVDTSGLLSIDTNTAEFAANKLKGDALNLKLQSHSVGTREALKMADGFNHVDQVALDMSHQDFRNTSGLSLNHKNLTGSFKSVYNNNSIHSEGKLGLIGKESFTNEDVASSRFYSVIQAKQGLYTETEGRHHNSGILSGGEGHNVIKARSIESKEARYGGNSFKAKYDGKNVVQLAESDINHQWVDIKSSQHTQLESKYGDIILSARQYTKHVKHDSYQAYDPSTITTNGHLFIEAARKLEAPMLNASVGRDAVLSGKKGVNLDSRASVYRSDQWDYRTGFFGWYRHIGYKEDVEFFRTKIQTGGDFIIKSSEGNIEAKGANFEATNGNIIADGYKGVNVNPLTAEVHSYKYNSSGWGISRSETNEKHTEVKSFGGVAKDKIQLTSADGKIEMRSAQITADVIALKGERGIDSRAIEIEQTRETKQSGISFNLGGYDTRRGKFNGPRAAIGISWQDDASVNYSRSGQQGNLCANHISVETGKGFETNLHGTNIQGLEPNTKVKTFTADTNKLFLGGNKTTSSTRQTSWEVGIGVDAVNALFAPQTGGAYVHGSYSDAEFTYNGYQQANVSIDNFINKRENAQVEVGNGVKGGINQASGEKFNLHLDHVQSQEKQKGWSAGGEIGGASISVHAGGLGGEKRYTEEGLTDFTITNAPNMIRTDSRYEDKDTRHNINVGVTLSKNATSCGGNVSGQIGDKRFSAGYYHIGRGNGAKGFGKFANQLGNVSSAANYVKDGIITSGKLSEESEEKLGWGTQGLDLVSGLAGGAHHRQTKVQRNKHQDLDKKPQLSQHKNETSLSLSSPLSASDLPHQHFKSNNTGSNKVNSMGSPLMKHVDGIKDSFYLHEATSSKHGSEIYHNQVSTSQNRHFNSAQKGNREVGERGKESSKTTAPKPEGGWQNNHNLRSSQPSDLIIPGSSLPASDSSPHTEVYHNPTLKKILDGSLDQSLVSKFRAALQNTPNPNIYIKDRILLRQLESSNLDPSNFYLSNWSKDGNDFFLDICGRGKGGIKKKQINRNKASTSSGVNSNGQNSDPSSEIVVRCKSQQEAIEKALKVIDNPDEIAKMFSKLENNHEKVEQISKKWQELRITPNLSAWTKGEAIGIHPFEGSFGAGQGKIVGVRQKANSIRSDYDPKKGAHINASIGKGSDRYKFAFTYLGDEEDHNTLTTRLSTPNGKTGTDIMNTLKNLSRRENST